MDAPGLCQNIFPAGLDSGPPPATLPAVKSLCVFCGSSSGADSAFTTAARALGETLARQGLTLVYGGGNVGLMGVIADAALAHGGKVIGVIPRSLVERELAHRRLTELHVVVSMHERKALMADRADGFIALPGGFGTLDEFCEILTWAQLGLHTKPCGVLNVNGFFDSFLAQVDRAVADRFIRPEHRALLLVGQNPDALLERMRKFQPPKVHKWIGRDEV
ncbi:MAG: TIGR00730 family Rossman fold protein [Verrucomicrobia bacterium]|nr:TIGR00730 family Rossman fold protein [Verrucomicrobiota bacterium]